MTQFLFALLLFIPCVLSAAEWKMCSDKQLAFEMPCMSDWERVQSEGAHSADKHEVNFLIPAFTKRNGVIQIYRQNLGTTSFQAVQQQLKSDPNVKVEQRTFAGLLAIQATEVRSGLHSVSYYTDGGKEILSVYFFAPENERTRFAPFFERVERGFRWLDTHP